MGIVDSREDFTFGQSVAMANWAFALRKINPDYSGNCVLLRRSSDNAEQAFGFDGSGNLDTANIESWGGTDSMYVKTWYDQSGKGHNVTQSTASIQPRLYNAGVLDTINGTPALYFDDNDILQDTTNYADIHGVYYAFASITQPEETVTSSWFVGTRHATNSNNARLQIGYNGSNAFKIAQWNNDASFTPTWSISTAYAHAGKKNNPAGSTLWQNGTLISTQTQPSNVQLSGSDKFVVGAGGGETNFFKGYIGEVIVWCYSISSAQLLVNHNNMKTYYGI